MLVELNPSKVCFVIVKIREFDIQAEEREGNSSNASDDGFASAYDERPNGSVVKKLQEFIRAMDIDEKRELVALSLVGRGDYTADEWKEALAAVASRPELGSIKELLENPTLSDELEEGLAAFGLSCEDYESGKA